MSLSQAFDRWFYPGVPSNWDDEIFREVILGRLRPDMTILDLGAGSGNVKQMNFRDSAARVCGIDLDPRVTSNPFLHDAKVGSAEKIPYPDQTFDLAFSDNVLEHLKAPDVVFAEVSRVLKPDGVFLAKTPNRFHYVPLVATLTPLIFHKAFNRMRGRQVEDTFGTHYRANSVSKLKTLCEQNGMLLEEARLIESRPEYLRFFAPFYAVGIAYERLVNRFESLAFLRVLLIGVATKTI
jgi:ubiquinone/menaquinone biosynthesis C-methylase UbiE